MKNVCDIIKISSFYILDEETTGVKRCGCGMCAHTSVHVWVGIRNVGEGGGEGGLEIVEKWPLSCVRL